MADPNTRQGKRTPVTLKIKFKSETLEQFIERYAVDVSQGGIFIRTKEPLAVGTQMRFEFQLRDASPLIAGEGTVVWTRENDPSRPAIAPGMGVRFDRLAEGSQTVLERILSEKAKQAPSRPHAESTKPPMFTDTPTRVAPMPVQDQLLGTESGRTANTLARAKKNDAFDDQGTPLPRPMPFHSDADDFDEKAFEEATKVRSLDELIAQTAGDQTTQTAAAPPAPDRIGRADSTLAEPPVANRADTSAETAVGKAYTEREDRESAPMLPTPPEPSRPQPRLLDTTPSPRPEEPPAPVASASTTGSTPATREPSAGESARTKLGMEPAKATTSTTGSTPAVKDAAKDAPSTRAPSAQPVPKDAPTKPTGMRAVAAAEPKSRDDIAPRKSSSAGLVILLLLLVAAGGAAVWFFVLRDKATEDNASTDTVADPGPGSGSAVAVPDPGPGSDMGSAAVMTGSGTGSGSDTVAATNQGSGATTPAAELVETQIAIAGTTQGATIEVIGTDQTGPAPLKAKLEKGKAYKARVSAPGFTATEVDVTGGTKPSPVKLVAKPRLVEVSSEPTGAMILVDGANTGKTTPFTIELTKAQAAKKSVRIGIRKSGYKPMEKVLDSTAWTEESAQMTAKVDGSLAVQVIQRPTNTNTNTGGSDTGTDTGTTGTDAGTGTTTTGTDAGTGTGTGTGTSGSGSGSGSTTPPTGTGTGTTGSGTSGTGTTGTTGSGTSGTGTSGTGTSGTGTSGTGAGSATKPADGPKPGTTTEPEPDFMKKP